MNEVNPRTEFPFPFTPYDVQKAFMTALYSALEVGKVGIFESPTGTGKSLSLLCGGVTWLRDHQLQRKARLEKELSCCNEDSDCDDDWFESQIRNKIKSDRLAKLKEEYEIILSQEKHIEELQKQHKRKQIRCTENRSHPPNFKRLMTEDSVSLNDNFPHQNRNSEDGEDEMILEDYHSASDSDISDDEHKENFHVMKIYFCSRTHSQLSQFMHEIQHSPFSDDLRAVALGSRKNLCINDAVQQLKSLNFMNDQCLQLQKNMVQNQLEEASDQKKQRKQHGSCPFYKQFSMKALRDHLLVEPKDIEESYNLGRQNKACPYYSSRYAIPEAEVVVLPYNVILQKSAREACGIKLEGNIVIIDEAHNLIETLNSIHSVLVQGSQLSDAHCQLTQYLTRFRALLNPKNLMYIKQILFVMSSILRYLKEKLDKNTSEVEVMKCCQFLVATKIDNINLFKILKYCERSQICRKLHGFSTKHNVEAKPKSHSISSVSTFLESLQAQNKPLPEASQNEHQEEGAKMSSPLMIIMELFRGLTNPSEDGRIIIKRHEIKLRSQIKFVLLNPASHFQDVLSEARSVILAGGTMEPVSEFIDQLLIPAGCPSERIVQFSCGHVIPKDNLLAVCLSHGPTNMNLEFTYTNRASKSIMEEAGRVLANLCTVVPGGVVCFFPSYEYEELVYKHWKGVGLIDRILVKKEIFREPRKSGDVAKILKDYAKMVGHCLSPAVSETRTGALLFSVVGGKMSEGINFADHLGRCVVVMGMPYPNMKSAELQEKISYMNTHFPKAPDGRLPGQVHYENLCMKAVNQSIGRAIRHKRDYACIVLLDSRYHKPLVRNLLPKWVVSDMIITNKFGLAFSSVCQFFARKRQSGLKG